MSDVIAVTTAPSMSGGARKKATAACVWQNSGRTVKVEGVVKTLWKNSKTGELKIKRITKRNGKAVASYVKVPERKVIRGGASPSPKGLHHTSPVGRPK
jgi:hypothetical protein